MPIVIPMFAPHLKFVSYVILEQRAGAETNLDCLGIILDGLQGVEDGLGNLKYAQSDYTETRGTTALAT